MLVVSENDQHYQNDALNNQMTNVGRREYLIREMSQYVQYPYLKGTVSRDEY
jgi:hypothetical protein